MLAVPARRDKRKGGESTEPVIGHLLGALRRAGVVETRFVIRTGKWDIPEFLSGDEWSDLAVTYAVTRGTAGVPQTVALGLRDCPDACVAFGFPDILVKPETVFEQLVRRMQVSDADLMLGLVPVSNPRKFDIVRMDSGGRVTRIDIKPERSDLDLAWVVAVWTAGFTRWFVDLCDTIPDRITERASAHGDVHLGHAFQIALDSGLRVEAEVFKEGRALDIGTPEDLDKAASWFRGEESA